jgi:uncharacterized membrane protein YkoI
MRKRTIIAVAAAVLALAVVGIGSAVAGRGGDDDGGKAATAAEKRAVAAALKITGGGTANAVERDSENGATWEVEVTKPGGASVDVRLDSSYGLVVVEGDSESEGGGDSGDS